jgi:hypothetical protein
VSIGYYCTAETRRTLRNAEKDSVASAVISSIHTQGGDYLDPDDLETEKREMWIVLQERPNPTEGYVVVYAPLVRNGALLNMLVKSTFS